MKIKYNIGDIVYIIANQIFIKEAKVVRVTASTRMYTLKFTEESGGTRLRENRLYATKQEAEFIANIINPRIILTKKDSNVYLYIRDISIWVCQEKCVSNFLITC
ncbi:hypothetical protein PND93_09215 [Faecalicoccus pleomorphus]|uniref:hypothetical protein n=1 Tax=Faecalicoccus pleomorphus TaxID=1323 RepID=UPI00232C8AF3|nr:hypothetical protein [Faecalicoccus pleomorphus]MDB7987008.1 hypothetical protein [Faecalicoccus pleomorphus]MDB7991770.1 hypothetical protein [Faecalicoccus pleomorphus]